MKKKVAALLIACTIGVAFIAACANSTYDMETKSKANEMKTHDAGVAVASDEAYEDLDFSYEGEEVYYETAENIGENDSIGAPQSGNQTPDQNADASKEMLVYRCNIALDTLNFDETLTTLKTKIEEYHGFVERENQTDGAASGGRYVLDEDEKDYYYTATIRIPSEYYDSFVNAASGIGVLRSKNSSVDNVATRYGTLKNELEIYEAEYDRYMKQYNETEDEQIALEIQYELRNLALTISDIKTEMSMLESDVTYSYVTISIHKVTQQDLDELSELKDDDLDESFGTRLSKTAKNSWRDFLGFLQGIVLFVVESWWVLLIMAIIAVSIILKIKSSIKKAKKKSEARRLELEAQQAERTRAFQEAKEKSMAENQAQIKARIAAQQAAKTEAEDPDAAKAPAEIPQDQDSNKEGEANN